MLSVLCLCLSYNSVPMAALTKEQLRQVDTDYYSKSWKKNGHKQPKSSPLFQKWIKDRCTSKDDTNFGPEEKVPLMKHNEKM